MGFLLNRVLSIPGKILKSSMVVYTSGSLFMTAVQIIANFVILAYIPPEQMGVWNSFILFQTYGIFFQAGIINGLNRELPFELGQGNDSKAISYVETAQFFTLLSILGVIISGAVLFVISGDSYLSRITIVTVALLTSLKFYENYLNSTFRSNQSFVKLGKVFYIRGILGLATIPIVIYLSYEGYIIRFVLVSLGFILALHLIRPFKVGLKFSKERFMFLMKTGMPIFAIGYFFQVANTSDRFWLLNFENTDAVGFYSFGLMVFGALAQLPLTIANYIYPRMTYAVGQNRDEAELWRYSFKMNVTMFLIFLPIAIAGYFLTPVVIRYFFIKYEPGIASTQILLFAAVFMASSIGNNLLWSLKSWNHMILLQVMGGIIIFIMPFLFLQFSTVDSLVGVSLGILIGQIIYCLLSNGVTYHRIFISKGHE